LKKTQQIKHLQTRRDSISFLSRPLQIMKTGESTIAREGDPMHIAHWLATQILAASKPGPGVKSAKSRLKNLRSKGDSNERRAWEHALIWMVLHTRPLKRLSVEQRRTLLATPNPDGTNWAALTLDKEVIRPILESGRWWHRCRFAESKFGFNFADEGVSFVWERIEKYRGGDFSGWLETVLGNYWKTLHRKWKRTIPKDSDAAKELESLAEDADQLRKIDGAKVRPAPSLIPGGKIAPPHAGANSFFSTSDSMIMSRWEPIDGILMGFELDLWQKVPRSQ
jgi:hypothetical protein